MNCWIGRWIGLGGLVLSVGCAVGCSPGAPPDGGVDGGPDLLPSPPLDPLATCLTLARAAAGREVSCGRLASPDFAAYVATQCPTALYAGREAAFDAGQLAFDAAARSCVLAIVAGSGSVPGLACNSPADPLAFCPPLGRGLRGIGEACDDPLSCAAGLFCERTTPGQACGVCRAQVALGAGCGASANGAVCGAGLCVTDNCRPLVGAGEQCALDTAACFSGLLCLSGTGLCGAPGGVGARCGSTAECADGLGCTPAGQCATALLDGGDCTATPCAASAGCVAGDGGATCVPFQLAVGPSDADAGRWLGAGPCAQTSSGSLCPEIEECRAAGCMARQLLGAACLGDDACLEGGCVDGGCALLATGTPCLRDAQCSQGRCDVGGTGRCGAACSY